MASLCKRQQCIIERRGFRQDLDSWRNKLIHCVGFESILEGLFRSRLVEDLTLFKVAHSICPLRSVESIWSTDCEPEGVSDWSFDENCLFCCLRREKVKEHLEVLEGGSTSKDNSNINRLERQTEEFLDAVLYKKADIPSFSDPHVPVVAREIMQRMICQFAAEYTSKASSSQDTPQPNGNKDQSLLKARSIAPPTAATATAAATAQNPVLSKLLMADQDVPLDLTVKKADVEISDQDGVLDLSTKKNRSRAGASLRTPHDSHPVKGRAVRDGYIFRDGDEGLPPRSLRDGMRENVSHSTPLKPPLTRSLQIKRELAVSQCHKEPMGLLNPRPLHPILSRNGSWGKQHVHSLLKLKEDRGLNDLKDLPNLSETSSLLLKGLASMNSQEGKKGMEHLPTVDLKIPRVRGMHLPWDSHTSNLYGYGSLVMSPHSENALHKRLRSILPKHRRGSLGGLDGDEDYWGSDVERSASGQPYPTLDSEGDPGSKQPRKKRGRYRQYNMDILEEAIGMVMGGRMSISKAQTVYGIPHSTMEYKVKERLGTLKKPPKKKLKLKMEGKDGVVAESEPVSTDEGAQSENVAQDE